MADLHIRFRNAARQPLNDRLDVRVVASASQRLVNDSRDVRGRSTLKVDVIPGQTYVVTARPRRHRAVGQMVTVPLTGPARADMFFPLHPEHGDPVFPSYEALPVELTRVLDRSELEGSSRRGRALFEALPAVERAGLLNLFCKMHTFGFDADHTVWSAVQTIYRIRPDRIFADVAVTLRDQVKAAEVEGRFRAVNGRLHQPPPEFMSAGSFKTAERYGNLQLSFFASEAAPLRFKVDADIDDAAGIGHVFQVLRNRITDSTTHPYDIHQILVFRQEALPPYDLA